MDLRQFDYDLPPERIAQTPVEPRHASRLMVVNRQSGDVSHHTFADIVQFIRPGDILVANDSRVIPARLYGRKPTGGKVEILLLKRINAHRWEALVGGKRLRPGVAVEIEQRHEDVLSSAAYRMEEPGSRGAEAQRRRGDDNLPISQSPNPSTSLKTSFPISLTIIEDLGGANRLIEFNQPIDDLLAKVGHVPLPPYIHKTLADAERYQTIFSRVDGSAAAPTAGLHFTPEILLQLRDQGVLLDYVTLHIGLDTFQPVMVEHIEDHAMHREVARLTPDTARRINEAKLAGGRLVAVGTTAVRTLETAALRSAGYSGSLTQISVEADQRCPWRPVIAIDEATDLYIYPGYAFRAVDVMLTNFHLPKSTLLMLVSAFAGSDLIRQAYEIAIAEKYRFFSFGDAMLIL